MRRFDASVEILQDQFLDAQTQANQLKNAFLDASHWKPYIHAFDDLCKLWTSCSVTLNHIAKLISIIRTAASDIPGILSEVPEPVLGLDPVRDWKVFVVLSPDWLFLP